MGKINVKDYNNEEFKKLLIEAIKDPIVKAALMAPVIPPGSAPRSKESWLGTNTNGIPCDHNGKDVWRMAHPDDGYGIGWICNLCNYLSYGVDRLGFGDKARPSNPPIYIKPYNKPASLAMLDDPWAAKSKVKSAPIDNKEDIINLYCYGCKQDFYFVGLTYTARCPGCLCGTHINPETEDGSMMWFRYRSEKDLQTCIRLGNEERERKKKKETPLKYCFDCKKAHLFNCPFLTCQGVLEHPLTKMMQECKLCGGSGKNYNAPLSEGYRNCDACVGKYVDEHHSKEVVSKKHPSAIGTMTPTVCPDCGIHMPALGSDCRPGDTRYNCPIYPGNHCWPTPPLWAYTGKPPDGYGFVKFGGEAILECKHPSASIQIIECVEEGEVARWCAECGALSEGSYIANDDWLTDRDCNTPIKYIPEPFVMPKRVVNNKELMEEKQRLAHSGSLHPFSTCYQDPTCPDNKTQPTGYGAGTQETPDRKRARDNWDDLEGKLGKY